jgi:hypothetical protein
MEGRWWRLVGVVVESEISYSLVLKGGQENGTVSLVIHSSKAVVDLLGNLVHNVRVVFKIKLSCFSLLMRLNTLEY